MNPKCAKCQKTVYPIEKFNCLDKAWHKACFQCTVCDLKLTSKTYKGYNKQPYCNTHYPTTSFTAVADTPEYRRFQKQTAKQFDEAKAQGMAEYTRVTDDLETLRAQRSRDLLASHSTQYDAPSPENPIRGGEYIPPAPKQEPSLTPSLRPPPQTLHSGDVHRAIYDYTSADDDEVSFVEGDIIVNTEPKYEGWIWGTVQRTGMSGMFPANYAEKAE